MLSSAVNLDPKSHRGRYEKQDDEKERLDREAKR